MRKFENRICTICRNTYTPTSVSQKICMSRECYNKRNCNLQLKIRDKVRESRAVRTCLYCGNAFEDTNLRRCFCSDECKTKQCKKKLKDWRDKNLKQCKISRSRYRQSLRDKFFEMYGISCKCCGETTRAFLTLDHVQNDGHIERKVQEKYCGNDRSYRLAVAQYDPERYQVLCYNCNFGRAVNNGICPHKTEEYGKEINHKYAD